MTETMTSDLNRLRLSYLAANFEDFINKCDREQCTTKSIVERLVQHELMEKDRRGIQRRLRAARLGHFKKILDFDWNWPKSINRGKIESLLEGQFVDAKRNIILAGAQGLGKTMLAKNIAYQSVIKGKTALFTTASDLVMTLQSKDNQVEINRALKRYSSPHLLVIDELFYLSYDCKAADLIFEVINRRYETGSIIFTTNLAFKDWNKIFPGAACLTAMIDRITHHLDVLKLEGESYRLMESKKGK